MSFLSYTAQIKYTCVHLNNWTFLSCLFKKWFIYWCYLHFELVPGKAGPERQHCLKRSQAILCWNKIGVKHNVQRRTPRTMGTPCYVPSGPCRPTFVYKGVCPSSWPKCKLQLQLTLNKFENTLSLIQVSVNDTIDGRWRIDL